MNNVKTNEYYRTMISGIANCIRTGNRPAGTHRTKVFVLVLTVARTCVLEPNARVKLDFLKPAVDLWEIQCSACRRLAYLNSVGSDCIGFKRKKVVVAVVNSD
eukprot:scaffold95272_cov50-Prasinocladus_malaysianus.AAC.1